jgi:TPR repeat protein
MEVYYLFLLREEHLRRRRLCPFLSSFWEFGKVPSLQIRVKAKTKAGVLKEVMNRVASNDPASIYRLAHSYQHGVGGFQQDRTKSMELYARAADLGFSKARIIAWLT